MNKNIHKEILKVCRKAWVTFGKVIINSDIALKAVILVLKYHLIFVQNMFAKDESGAYNLLPIKEQCGVTDPYVISYGEEAGTMRDFTWADTCACVKNPREAGWSFEH